MSLKHNGEDVQLEVIYGDSTAFDNIVAMKKDFYTPPYIVTAYPANGSTVSADISEIISVSLNRWKPELLQ